VTAAAVLVTGQDGIWGAIVGFVVGLVLFQWLFRDLAGAMEDDLSRVLARYVRSLVIRWSCVALVVLIVMRMFARGLIYLVIGLALGVMAAILMEVLKITRNTKEKGGEK